MKNKILFFVVVVVLTCAGVIVYFNEGMQKNADAIDNLDKKHKVQNEIDNINKDLIEEKINDTLDSMSIEEKIGQMLVIYHSGDVLNADYKLFLDEIKPGGIILLKDNFSDYEGTKKFIRDFKNTSSVPMIVSVDQEGG